MSVDQLEKYYERQGKGIDDVSGFRSSYLTQRGRGFWSRAFANLWRVAKPLVTSIRDQALSTGGKILTDYASAPPEQTFKDIAKQRAGEAQRELAAQAGTTLQKMAGRGRKRKNGGKKSKAQLGSGRGSKKRKTTAQRGKGMGTPKRGRQRQTRARTCGKQNDIFR